jgi:hypothetical protein
MNYGSHMSQTPIAISQIHCHIQRASGNLAKREMTTKVGGRERRSGVIHSSGKLRHEDGKREGVVSSGNLGLAQCSNQAPRRLSVRSPSTESK